MIDKLVKLFAIFAVYLFISIPVARATIIHFPSYSSSNDIVFNSSDYVTISVTADTSSSTDHKIIVEVENATADYDIEKVYVHRCKGMNPNDCITGGVTIDESNTNFEKTYHWFNCELSQTCDRYSNFPQNGNIMILTRVADSSGGLFWVGSWYNIERSGINYYTINNHEPEKIDVYVDSGLASVKEYINDNKMIPIYSSWISKVAFYLADSIFHINTNNFPVTDSAEITGNEILQNDITKNYNFIFADTGSYVMNAMTLSLHTPGEPLCGDGACDGGETSTTCCYDCGCSSNWYCDGGTDGYCKLINDISLELYSAPSEFIITDCSASNDITIYFRLNNQPDSITSHDLTYRLDVGGEEFTGTCSNVQVNNNIYSCTMTVPAIPGCEGTGYELSPNYVSMTLVYDDGSQPDKTKVMIVGFGKIIQGSFDCGNGICEDSLGESYNICCYDCSCVTGNYCDSEYGTAPGVCKLDLTDYNIDIVNYDNLNFDTHDSVNGDTVTLDLEIENKPEGLEFKSVACNIGCTDCSVSCDISCGPDTSTDYNYYATTCDLVFNIADYSSSEYYTLQNPEILVNVEYFNSSKIISKQLTTGLPNINIGGHFCGDGVCDDGNDGPNMGESSSNCCYDCDCPTGNYCDTADTNAPTTGDECKPVSGIDVILDAIDSNNLNFNDALSTSNEIIITGSIANPPSGLSMSSSCIFNSGGYDVPCDARWRSACTWLEEPNTFECLLGIQKFDYRYPSFLDYDEIYDVSAREISFSENSLSFKLEFNNGSEIATVTKDNIIGEVTIDVLPTCGDGICNNGSHISNICLDYNTDDNCIEYYIHQDLGESYDSSQEDYPYACCSDCTWEEEDPENPVYYCDRSGDEPPYERRVRNAISIRIDHDNTYLPCAIYPYEGTGRYACYFTNAETVDTDGNLAFYIVDPPADFVFGMTDNHDEIIFPSCENPDYDFDARNTFIPVCGTCSNDPDMNIETEYYYNCRLGGVGYIDESDEGETTNRLLFTTTISYGGGEATDDLTTTESITITKENSYELTTLEQRLNGLEETENALRIARGILIGFISVIALVCIILGFTCGISGTGCPALVYCADPGICIDIAVITGIVTLSGQIEAYKNKIINIRDYLISGTGDEFLNEEASSGYIIAETILGIVGIICTIVMGAVDIKSGASAAADVIAPQSGMDLDFGSAIAV